MESAPATLPRTPGYGVITMRLVVILLAPSVLAGCKSDPCGSELSARTMAESAVMKHLRDPGSAKFDRPIVTQDEEDACIYVVMGRFSSRNGFGGMTSGAYIAEMHKSRGANLWRAVDLAIE